MLRRFRSSFRGASIALSWPVARILLPSHARRFVGAWLRAVLVDAQLDATNVRQLLKRRRLEYLYLRSALTTGIILVSGCSNANTCVAFLVPRNTNVTRNACNCVDNAVVIDSVKSHAGNLAHHACSHANGIVPTNRVRWCAAR